MTPEQWLQLTDDKLALELVRVLTPGPWKHDAEIDRYGFGDCRKCSDRLGQKRSPEHCPVPDPITIDWNTAMEWRDKVQDGYLQLAMIEVWNCTQEPKRVAGKCEDGLVRWLTNLTQPKHYLIAAALVAERNEE